MDPADRKCAEPTVHQPRVPVALSAAGDPLQFAVSHIISSTLNRISTASHLKALICRYRDVARDSCPNCSVRYLTAGAAVQLLLLVLH